MASIITWNGLSKFLTLLNTVANQSRPYNQGSVQHPHDRDVIAISLHDIAIRLRGYPNKLRNSKSCPRHCPTSLRTWIKKRWEESAKLQAGEPVLLERPLGAILGLFHFDLIHHRGQLSTYLRPMGLKVPSIYGRSGDDTAR